MGSLCSPKKNSNFNLDGPKFEHPKLDLFKPPETPPGRNVYADKIREYMSFYGKNVDDRTRDFIEQNYNPNYKSTTYPSHGNPVYTYKYTVRERLQTAFDKKTKTFHYDFIKANLEKRSLHYTWSIMGYEGDPNEWRNHFKRTYDCEAIFDEQDRFLSITLSERYNPEKYKTDFAQTEKKATYQSSNSSNNFYVPTVQNKTAEQYVAESNAQFRANMNKQAQEWNNYVQQQQKRGW